MPFIMKESNIGLDRTDEAVIMILAKEKIVGQPNSKEGGFMTKEEDIKGKTNKSGISKNLLASDLETKKWEEDGNFEGCISRLCGKSERLTISQNNRSFKI